MLHSGPGKDAFGTCLATGGISWCFCAPFSQRQSHRGLRTWREGAEGVDQPTR